MPAWGAFTPGRYEIQDLGGNAVGTLAVSEKKTTYDEKPATRVEWHFIYTKPPFKSVEKHEAIFNEKGLVEFHKRIEGDGMNSSAEGKIINGALTIKIDNNGQRFAQAIGQGEYEITEYDLEKSGSPFFEMKLKEARSAKVFSGRELAVSRARRNINEIGQAARGEKRVPALVANTAFSQSVTTSWFDPKTRVLLKERWPDRQFVRTGD